MWKISNNPVTILKGYIATLMVLPVLIWLDGCFSIIFSLTSTGTQGCFTGLGFIYLIVAIFMSLASFYYVSKIKKMSQGEHN